MFQKVCLVISCVFSVIYCISFENEWQNFEKEFKNHNREEIFLTKLETDGNFNLNYTVLKWFSIKTGPVCYTAGISDNSLLVVLFSTASENQTSLNVKSKVFDLKKHTSEIYLFSERKSGEQKIFVIAYHKQEKELAWYQLDHYSLNKVWSWPIDKNISHFKTFKMGKNNMLLIILSGQSKNDTSMDIYQFSIEPLDRWFHQSLLLTYPAETSAINQHDSTYYLSVPQPTLNQIQVFQYIDNRFIPFQNLTSPNATQVVSFENGFKTFIAFNGAKASIYQFVTHEGLVKEDIVNSNFESIEFWLPIPVETYRDETILLIQRRLDHEDHFSFDVDVITYNGRRFEEHEDISCLLFDEIHDRLTCLVELNSKYGIYGASYIAVLDKLALLIPGFNTSSLLFNVNIDVRKVEHPKKKEIDHFVEHKNKLQSMIQNINKEFEEIEIQKKSSKKLDETDKQNLDSDDLIVGLSQNTKVVRNLSELTQEVEQVAREIEELNRKFDKSKFENVVKFDRITFNNGVEINGNLNAEQVITELLLDQDANEILNDVVRKNDLKVIQGNKTFAELQVEELNLKYLNGISLKEFLLFNNKNYQINGDITFANNVYAENLHVESGLVNDVEITKEFLHLDNIRGPLIFEQLNIEENFKANLINNIKLDENSTILNSFEENPINKETNSMHIPGNLTVKNINGEDFENFLKKLCLENKNCQVPDLTLIGNLTVSNLQIKKLNGLEYPNEFVTIDGSYDLLVINSIKTFTNVTRGFKVVTETTLNNMELQDLISLSEEQYITGVITFNDLGVEKALDVDGRIKGKEIENFTLNIGLNKTNLIKSNVEFENLEVFGNIVVKDQFNNTKFDDYLQNFILTDDESSEIFANKTFVEGLTVRKNLELLSNEINNISLSSLITKGTEQQLYITFLETTANFNNLYVNGLFDQHNITELNENLIKLNGSQNTSSELIFTDPVVAETLIFEELNTFKPDDIATRNNDILKKEILEAEHVFVEGNVIGDIEDFDLEKLSEDSLYFNEDQIVTEPFFVDRLTTDDLRVHKVNNYTETSFSYKKYLENITDFLFYRNVSIEILSINKKLQVKQVNDKELDEKLRHNLWMKLHSDKANKIIVIDGDAYFETLNITHLSGVNFDDYVNNLVFKDENNVEIKNSVTFENGISIKRLLETKKINGIKIENILRKEGKQTINSPIEFIGNVTVEDDLKVNNMINNVDVKYFSSNIDIKNMSATIKGEVMFNRLAYINELEIIDGQINNRLFDDIKSNFVYTSDDVELEKDIVFLDTVSINGNLGTKNGINGVVLSQLANRIVWITKDIEIEGPVIFTRPIEIYKSLKVNEELNTRLLYGQDLQEHISRAVFLNKGLLKGTYNFNSIAINESLDTKFINHINLKNIITLKTSQHLPDLMFKKLEITNEMIVGNSVNGVKLKEEFDRTLLSNTEQDIRSEIVFSNNVLIEENLIASKINNQPASKIVTTNTDQNLFAIYSFNAKCWTDKHLNVYGLINKINLTNWASHGIDMNSEESQILDEKWNIEDDLNLEDSVKGNGLISGYNISQLVDEIEERKNFRCDLEKDILNDYKNLCTDVSYIHQKTKNQIYKFAFFKELQEFSIPNTITFVKYLRDQGQNYLLINEEGSCLSHLMKYNEHGFHLVKRIDTGRIAQAEIVIEKDEFILVSRGDDSENLICDVRFSTVVWKFKNEDLKVLSSIENQELLQESLVPLTFYGLRHGLVTEFRIDKQNEYLIRSYRQWEVNKENAAFLPRGFNTGLAIRTADNLYFLNQVDSVVEDDFEIETQTAISGNVTEEINTIIPGKNEGDLLVFKVGVKAKKTFMAIAKPRTSQVEHRLDLVEIYSDPFKGELFDKIPTYKPTCLTSIEFENGETLIAFIEQGKYLQIYEYKGIEGFNHRSTIKIQANHIFLMHLPVQEFLNPRIVLGVVYKRKITLIQAIMVGNKIEDDVKCGL